MLPRTRTKHGLPTRVEIEPGAANGLDETSYARCEDIRSLSERRLVDRIGAVDRIILENLTPWNDGCMATSLAEEVLPLIRSRAELWRYSIANQHGVRMHEAVDVLESAIPTTDAAELHSVTHKALASAITVIARADDSSGIIVTPAAACWRCTLGRRLPPGCRPAGWWTG